MIFREKYEVCAQFRKPPSSRVWQTMYPKLRVSVSSQNRHLATAREIQLRHCDTTGRLWLSKLLLLNAQIGSHFIQSLYFPQSYWSQIKDPFSGHFAVPIDFMVFGFSPLDGFLEASWQTWTVHSLPCSLLACPRLGQYLFLLHYCQSKHLGNGIIASLRRGNGG